MGPLIATMILMLLGCAPKLVGPDFEAPEPGPFWPAPPDAPRVAWVGEIRPPTGRFIRPIDVACGASHRIAVADVDAATVWVLDVPERRAFSLNTSTAGPLEAPVGVAFDGAGGLYVVDARRASVLRGRDDRRGPLAGLLPEGQLIRPTAVVSRSDGSLLLVDAGAHTIVRATLGGEIEPVAVQRGGPGVGLNFPVDVAVGAHGELFVADALNASIERIDPSGAISLFAGGWPERPGTLVRPKGVAVDAKGNLHVVDGAMQHVEVYNSEGRLLGRYGGPGTGPGELGLPAGICLDEDGHIFVADSLNGRVQVYKLLGGT